MQKILKTTAIFLMAAVMLIISGCSDANGPSGSEIEISEIENSSEIENGSEIENNASSESGSSVPQSEGNNSSTDSPSGEPSYEDVKIETPYCTISFPGDWGTFLETEIDDGKTYGITFRAKLDSGKKQDLFTIRFGDLDDSIGTIKTPDGKTVEVWAESADFKPGDDWTDNEAHIVFSMMEILNDILAEMDIKPLEQESSQGSQSQGNNSGSETSRPGTSELPPDMAEDMALDTPYGELHYPMRWSEYFGIEIGEENGVYRVEFYSNIEGLESKQIFTVYYGGSEGYTVKKIKSDGKLIEVKLSMEELSFDENWSEDEKRIVYAMQEDVNYLIDALE